MENHGAGNGTEAPTGPPSSVDRQRLIGLFLAVSASLLAFWTAYFPIRFSNDPWWHIKGGKVLWDHLCEHGSLPRYDLFTLKGDEVRWINHEWLSDMLMYGAYSGLGLPGLMALKAAGVAGLCALIVFILRQRGCSLAWAGVGGLFAILMAQVSLFLRPHLLTYAFVAIWMELMMRLKRSDRPGRLLGVCFAVELLWINLHGGGILGILLCCIAFAEDIWWWFTGAPPGVETDNARRMKRTLACLGITVVASLLNPYGYQVHLLPAVVLRDPILLQLIGELDAPSLQFVLGLKILYAVLILLLLTPARRSRPFEILTLLFFTHEATKHVRHIPLLAVTSALVLTPLIQQTLEWFDLRAHEKKQVPRRILACVRAMTAWRVDAFVAFLLVAYTMGWNLAGNHNASIWARNWDDKTYTARLGYKPAGYPTGAVDYLLRNKLSGPMFHDDNFAGYLIYRLAPETMRVYTDSRYDLFGSYYAKEQLAVRGAWSEPYGLYADDGRWFAVHELGIPERVQGAERALFWRTAAQRVESAETLAWLDSGKPYWRWVLDDKYAFNLIMLYRNNDDVEAVLRKPGSGWDVAYESGTSRAGYVLFQRAVTAE